MMLLTLQFSLFSFRPKLLILFFDNHAVFFIRYKLLAISQLAVIISRRAWL